MSNRPKTCELADLRLNKLKAALADVCASYLVLKLYQLVC